MQNAAWVLFLSLAGLGGGTQPGELGANGIAPPSRCAQCHAQPSTRQLPIDRYRATPMHLASVDPMYLAALEIAFADVGAGAEMCVRCHVPTGWLAGRAVPANGSRLSGSDKHGISCDLCHRSILPELPAPLDAGVPDASAPDTGAPDGGGEGSLDGGAPDTARGDETTSDAGTSDAGDVADAAAWMPDAAGDDGGETHPPEEDPRWSGLLLENAQLFLETSGDIKYGPHGSAPPQGHQARASDLLGDSRLCAACHEVTLPETPRRNLDGSETGRPMPIERTYTEWKNSVFSRPSTGKTCQQCHMRSYSGVAATQTGVPERTLSDHEIVGANTVVSRMVAHLYASRDLDEFRGLAADAERVTEAARRMLREESATLDVVPSEVPGQLRVRVTNQTGHKLPTGYAEGRRMWIAHQVTYLDGRAPLRTGTPDPSTWDFVSGEEPRRIWEIKLGAAADGAPSFHFALVDTVYKDNRIPPEGFIPNEDTAAVGHTYPILPDGTLSHWDDIDLPLGENNCWPLLVDVTLYYQTASGEYYRFLRDHAPNARADLESAWLAVGGAAAEPMQRLRLWVHADGRSEVAGEDADQVQCLPAAPADAGMSASDASGSDAGHHVPVDAAGEGDTDGGAPGAEPTPESCTCAGAAGSSHGMGALLGIWLWRRRRAGRR